MYGAAHQSPESLLFPLLLKLLKPTACFSDHQAFGTEVSGYLPPIASTAGQPIVGAEPTTPALTTKVYTAAAPEQDAAAAAGTRPAAAVLPPRQGVHVGVADEMRRRPQHQSHGSLQSPRLTPPWLAQHPARRQPQLKKQYQPPSGRRQRLR